MNRVIRGLVSMVALALFSVSAQAGQPEHWVATWATAVKAPTPVFDAGTPPPSINDTTIRQIVRISVGGEHFRVWLTNEFGTEPLTISAAHLALRLADSEIVGGSDRTLTFGGEGEITIPAGARVVSDPVGLAAPDLSELVISIHIGADLSASASPVTWHVRALQTNYVADGDATDATSLPGAAEVTQWYFLSGVDVAVHTAIPVIAALGDSITDGDQLATAEPVGLNHRYTDFLSELILGHPGNGQRVGKLASVINAGISGGQVTDTLIGENALARLDRDVLTRTGVTHVIVLEGINDIGLPAFLGILEFLELFPPLEATFGRAFPLIEAAEIIAVHQQIIARARARGLKVIGATLTPTGGSLPGYFGDPADAKRQAVNDWIRNSGEYDVVLDFDRVLRDPANQGTMQEALTADFLHPNSDGYRAMAREAYETLFPGVRRR